MLYGVPSTRPAKMQRMAFRFRVQVHNRRRRVYGVVPLSVFFLLLILLPLKQRGQNMAVFKKRTKTCTHTLGKLVLFTVSPAKCCDFVLLVLFLFWLRTERSFRTPGQPFHENAVCSGT